MNRKDAAELASKIYHFLADKDYIDHDDIDYIIRSLTKLKPAVFGWDMEINNAISRVRRLKTSGRKNFDTDKELAISALVGIAIQASNFE